MHFIYDIFVIILIDRLRHGVKLYQDNMGQNSIFFGVTVN